MRSPSLLHRATVLALLAWNCVAVAQPPVARARREQRLVLSERTSGGELELRVARFDAEVVRAELKGAGAGRLPEPESVGPRLEGGPSSPFPVTEMMRKLGLSTGDFQGRAVGTGVRVKRTWDYGVAHGRLIVLDVRNPEGARPWFASEVVRVSPAGVVLAGGGGWAVHMEAPIEPGGSGEVVLAAPEVERDAPVRLEVREKGGSRIIWMEESR